MASDEIKNVLALHAKWLQGEDDGVKANLSGADLSGANLSGADLSGANLSGADLSGANLSWANLYGANLSWANLSGANLSGANLSRADLYGANLSGANLSGANLSGANLSRADLSGANLSWANLYGANLSWANLSGANLSGANLSRADLYGANLSWANLKGALGLKEQPVHTRILPEGTLIGWKKVRSGVILKLEIPIDAKRVSTPISRKCRASKALVLEAFGPHAGDEVFYSIHDSSFTYRVGQTVEPELPFNDTWLNDCESGIHFFITREEAETF